MSDADGDSQMHSSPELDEADEMFPDEGGPSTPRNPTTFDAAQLSELSPPNSQGGPSNLPRDDRLSASFTANPSALNANGKRVHASASGEHTDPETGYAWSKNEDQPGFEWKNSRAREEEVRMLDMILDKSSMIRARYGDPLDASIPAKGKRQG